MEHTLGVWLFPFFLSVLWVLILVLVEHTLGVLNTVDGDVIIMVLILVLVEHTLGALCEERRHSTCEMS